MSEQRRTNDEKSTSASNENTGGAQRKPSGDRRRGSRRRTRPSESSHTRNDQHPQGENLSQQDNPSTGQRRSRPTQRQSENKNPENGRHSGKGTSENVERTSKPASRRRRGNRSRRSRSETPAQDAVSASEDQKQFSSEHSSRSKSERVEGDRSQSSRLRRSRGRRSTKPDTNAQETEITQTQSGRRKRSDGSDQNRSRRKPSGEQSQGSQRSSTGARSKRGRRQANTSRRSPQRIFSPGKEVDDNQPEGTGSQVTYVSLLNRFNPRPPPSVPIPTDRGIKARSQRGTFSQNWWARRWIEAMEKLVDPARLQRGRSYARSGQVLSINETSHGIEAKVQGSRPSPYKVVIQVTPLTDEQWAQVIDTLSEQAIFTAQLLAGEMPADIEDAFHTANVSLFPDRPGDLHTSCSCPDWANPCKHVAATHYILGDRFDDDPFLLFRMRGRSQEQILAELNQRRGGIAEADDAFDEEAPVDESDQPGVEELLDHFWEPVESLDTFPLTIKPPSIDMPLLTRLGEPAFLPGLSLINLLHPVYKAFTYAALRAAYSEEEPVEPSPSQEENPIL